MISDELCLSNLNYVRPFDLRHDIASASIRINIELSEFSMQDTKDSIEYIMNYMNTKRTRNTICFVNLRIEFGPPEGWTGLKYKRMMETQMSLFKATSDI